MGECAREMGWHGNWTGKRKETKIGLPLCQFLAPSEEDKKSEDNENKPYTILLMVDPTYLSPYGKT